MLNYRCINKIDVLKLNLTSNIFTNNHAINGGAIFLEDEKMNKSGQDRNIVFKNNTFQNNIADEFGGALYADYKSLYNETASNNTISNNSSKVMGAGIFAQAWFDKNQFNVNNNIIYNNTINSYHNDYTSKPSYITLDTKLNFPLILNSGDHFPLVFSLYDKYDNIIEDITKYYSSITIKIILQPKYEDNYYDEENNNNNNEYNIYYSTNTKTSYKLYGNIGTFIKGIYIYI